MRSGSVGELFNGAHTRVVRKPSQSAKTIKVTMGNFFTVGVTCLCCHTPIRALVQNKGQKINVVQSPPGLSTSLSTAQKQQAVCNACKIQGKEGYTPTDTLDTVRRPFECSSKDCALFYYKNKMMIDLEDAYGCLNRDSSMLC
ncbi:MAG: hypothetical protein EZS28_013194 [Streblomastix strix]|uniref:Uncharacterized protein n=1 Tax=Streblomastix strix TaxID=222440 RepID=A0A5J4W999_9EUKA|nr:MAG: hypothetical protein EZS28_013194 [Streblomastix strix]